MANGERAAETIYVPARAEFSVEHERGATKKRSSSSSRPEKSARHRTSTHNPFRCRNDKGSSREMERG